MEKETGKGAQDPIDRIGRAQLHQVTVRSQSKGGNLKKRKLKGDVGSK